MRALLDSLYRLAGGLAAAGLVATLVMVSAGIVTRPLGIYLRGSDDYAGYCMAAAGFLALAYTFKHGEHIRVSLLLERLSAPARRIAEWIALAAACAVTAMFAWYSVRLAWQSYTFDELSQGVDATPLWIPQLTMAAGSVVFLVALVDDLVARTRGREPARLGRPDAEAARFE